MNFGTCQSCDEVILLMTFLNVKIVLHNIHAAHPMGWKEVVHLIYKTVRAASFMKLRYDNKNIIFFSYFVLVAQVSTFKREKNSFYLLCKWKIRIKWEEISWSNNFHVHWLVRLQQFWHSILRNRCDIPFTDFQDWKLWNKNIRAHTKPHPFHGYVIKIMLFRDPG